MTTLEKLIASELKQLQLFGAEQDDIVWKIEQYRNLLESRDYCKLAAVVEPADGYRVALQYPKDTIFLDIETTGLSRYYDQITLIGWLRDKQYGVYVRGGDLEPLLQTLATAAVVVTYNGTLFDLPFVKKELPQAQLPPFHVDLRFLAKREGLAGGQKSIEQEIGVSRAGEVSEVDGELAPVLWARYRRGDLVAIRKLLRYNHADVHGLTAIFDETVRRILRRLDAPDEICDRVTAFYAPKPLRISRKANSNEVPGQIRIAPYVQPDDAPTSLKSLYDLIRRSDIPIVGIDLTGSSKRSSGWCVLRKYTAKTKLLDTDEAIIEETVKVRPRLVSIDSPLSLPRGRVVVSDDDPGRSEFGIMRTSERILKRRGINVYPCLLPSMQKLTARGIALAKEFRKRGIPVIESYPGAAQDIMNIPRKRAGLDLLRAGLRDFGICGSYLRKNVSHDELDAITSAVVGAFFFAGKFEALGEEEEEALIVPELRASSYAWLSRIVVGFSGPLAAGKTSAANILKEKGFSYGRYSMVLSEELRIRGIPPSRGALQDLGLNVNQVQGQRWLGRRLVRLLPASGNLVIDGIRFPDDVAFLVETFGRGFIHVHLDAPAELRRRRYVERGGSATEFDNAQIHDVESCTQTLSTIVGTRILSNASSSLSTLEREITELVKDSECQSAL